MLLVALALAAPPPVLVYTLPEASALADVAAYGVLAHAPKDRLFVATEAGELRHAPAPDAERMFTLETGTPVEVLQVGTARHAVDGRVDGWYLVRAGTREGWMHGGDLTPYAFRDDLDQDGDEEVVTVFFEAGFQVRVLVFEPTIRAGNHAWIDLEPAGGAFLARRGGQATAALLKAKVASIPLVHVASAPDASGDTSDYWVSYRAPAAGRIGVLRVALEQHGVSDPPVSDTYTVEFSGSRKTARVTHTRTTDEGGAPEVESATWTLIDGVYHVERGGRVIR